MAKANVEIHGKNYASGPLKEAARDLRDLSTVATAVAMSFKSFESIGAIVGRVAQAVGDSVDIFAETERAGAAFSAAISQAGQLSGGAAGRLEEFASQMSILTGETSRSVSSLATFLATSGRTETEIKKIITVAADMSVATGQTLDGAVRQLNKTFGGLAGELGESIPEIRELTAEQNKAGAAVDLLAEKYDGLAESLRDTTDVSLKNYANALETVQSELGRSAERNLKPLRDWVTSIASAWGDSLKAMNDYHDAQERRSKGIEKEGDARTIIQGQISAVQSNLSALKEAFRFDPLAYANNTTVLELNRRLGELARSLALTAQAEKAAADAAKKADAKAVADKKNKKDADDSAYRADMSERAANGLNDFLGKIAAVQNTEALKVETAIKEMAASFVEMEADLKANADTKGDNWDVTGGGFDLELPAWLTKTIGAFDEALGMASGGMTNLFAQTGTLGTIFQTLTVGAGPLGVLAWALSQVFEGLLEILEPYLDILDPIVGILKIIGKVLGASMIPAFKLLAPVIDAVADAFMWFYKYVLRPVGNGIYASLMVIVNSFLNFGTLIANIAKNLFNPSKWKMGNRSTDWQDLYENGPMEDLDTVAQSSDSGATATTGASASYTTPRDITVNVVINADALVGEGGIRDFALMIGRELRSAGVLGMA